MFIRKTIKPRRSTAIAELRYNKRERTLTVQYLNGGRYIYASVTPTVWQLIREQGKKEGYGKAVNAIVKPNHNFMKLS
jgi:hypothetical protein